MSSERADDTSCWYAIHTHLKQEDRAEHNLKAWGVETFNPKLRELQYKNFRGPTYVIKPLFPRYIFARFVANILLNKISYTRGVHYVVHCGNMPTKVDDEIIHMIKSRRCADGYITIGDQLKQGDKVIIKYGSLTNFIGVFERDATDQDRVLILLTSISYQGHVEIEKSLVRKIA